eukprot:3140254-Pleurochrysis_carterae.AAC.1
MDYMLLSTPATDRLISLILAFRLCTGLHHCKRTTIFLNHCEFGRAQPTRYKQSGQPFEGTQVIPDRVGNASAGLASHSAGLASHSAGPVRPSAGPVRPSAWLVARPTLCMVRSTLCVVRATLC